MQNIVYSEWVPAGTLVKTLVAFVSSLILCVLLIVIAVGVAIQIPFLIVVLVSPLAFVLFLFWNYRGIQIQVINKELLISYGFFNHKHIPISNIASCKHTKTPLWKYGGAGVRYCFTDRSWAYTTSFGNAVKIIQRKGKSFVFSSNNPEKLCSIINQIKAHAKGF
ncbi:MAG: hypothetical protein IBX40_13055 [Methanosarcinales archaeon]|nr:hypothetical protein [Methanosarcinales archaeon]